MPKVSSFMYAANCAQEPSMGSMSANASGPMHIIGPLPGIVLVNLPSTFSFFVVFGITDFDMKTSHNILISFRDETGNEIGRVASPVPPLPSDPNVNIPDPYRTLMSSVGFQNLLFASVGLYKTVIILDDKEIGSFEIFVTRKNQ